MKRKDASKVARRKREGRNRRKCVWGGGGGRKCGWSMDGSAKVPHLRPLANFLASARTQFFETQPTKPTCPHSHSQMPNVTWKSGAYVNPCNAPFRPQGEILYPPASCYASSVSAALHSFLSICAPLFHSSLFFILQSEGC
jgi:hypothetical protein